MKRLVLFMVLAFSAACFAQGTYYIDRTNGSDNNAGTKVSPWKNHPDMACASGTFGGYTHVAGDHFLFKGNTTWPNACFMLNVSNSGTAGAHDYFGVEKDGNGVITWVAGGCTPAAMTDSDSSVTKTIGSTCKPVFDLEYAATTFGYYAMYFHGPSYVDVDNIEMKRLFIPSIGNSSNFIEVDGSHDLNLTNLWLHSWQQVQYTISTITNNGTVITVTTTAANDFTTGDRPEIHPTTGDTANCSNAPDDTGAPPTLTVTGATTYTIPSSYHASCTSASGGWTSTTDGPHGGVEVASGGAATVLDHSLVENSDWSSTTRNAGLGVHNITTVSNSSLHDLASLALGIHNAIGNLIYNIAYPQPSFSTATHSNGFYMGNGDSTMSNNFISRGYAAGAAPFYPSPHPASDTVCSGGSFNVYVYNNVVRGLDAASNIPYVFDGSSHSASTPCDNFFLLNNTFASTGGYRFDSHILSVLNKNNHVINGTAVFSVEHVNVTTYTTATNLPQTTANATSQGYVSANNYAPANNSGSTVGVGSDLTSLSIVALDTAFLGNARPNGSAWDIGAYMLGGAAPTCTLTASPAVIKLGTSSTLTFTPANTPTGCSIDNGVGAVSCSGATPSVSPTTLTTYTATVTNAGGTNTCSATVTIGGMAATANTKFGANTVAQ